MTPSTTASILSRSSCAPVLLAAALLALASASTLPTFAADDPAVDAGVLVTLRAEAEDGQAASKITLANVLAYGEGATSERRAEAALWYRRAAEQGDAEGQFTVALWLWLGEDVEMNRTEALQWWRKAADQGRSDAQFWLASAYENGEGGLGVDAEEAARWYRRSADQGFDESQSSLGEMYGDGRGVPQDDREAVRWLKKAADQHCASGQHALGEMYAAGRGVAKDDKEAVRLYGLAADQDFTVSMTALGDRYVEGRGVEKDRACAYFWYGFAAKRGFSIGEEDRDALAPKLSDTERAEGERLVAFADFRDGVVQRALCPRERLSIDVTDAALEDVLRALESSSGWKILGPEGRIPDRRVTAKLDDVTWETALTRVLASKGFVWQREGEAIRIAPKGKKR
ncbi:MAG TPA: hypothetical protein VGS22_20360 [Thermoanaerobaculia bacterium]|jgi:TPR repeat protein|nr:hypothetical protein [Thermoanaerobaculia bacterium]